MPSPFPSPLASSSSTSGRIPFLTLLLLSNIFFPVLHYIAFAVVVGFTRHRNPFAFSTFAEGEWGEQEYEDAGARAVWINREGEVEGADEASDDVRRNKSRRMSFASDGSDTGEAEEDSSEDDPDEIMDMPPPAPASFSTPSLRSRNSRFTLMDGRAGEEGRSDRNERGYGTIE